VGDLLSGISTAISKDLKAVESGVDSLAKSVGRGTVSAAHNAEDAGQQIADALAGPLRGTSVGADGKIRGPLAQKFGSDPVQFALNGVAHALSRFVELSNRASSRVGRSTTKVKDNTGRVHEVKHAVTKSSKPVEVAASVVTLSAQHPAVVADEIQRIMLGVPAGKGLDGFVGVRHLFGIDDAVLFGAIATIIVGLGTALLPIIVSLIGGVLGGDDKKKQEEAAAQAQEQQKNFLLIGAGVVAVGVVLFFVFHKKGGAAPAPSA
jgi:hypothetical protein